MLGRAESAGSQNDLFQLVDKKFRIYQRRPSMARMDLDYQGQEKPAKAAPGRGKQAALRSEPGGLQGEAMRLLLNRYAPPAVIVDADLRIVHARGQTGNYLELAPGDASLNLLKMTREGLLYGLRAALNEAKRSGVPVRKTGLRVKNDGRLRNVTVEVAPLSAVSSSNRHYLVLFEAGAEDVAAATPKRGERPARTGRASTKQMMGQVELRTSQLQQELAASREYLQSIIQDLEATNEELQSANEEILSSNEELQSTNEELDTAKEELQSTNEEINTVNEELQARNEELSRANSDLLNLLAGVQIAIVFLTSDLRIRRFTPTAERLLNLIPGDVGRPIGNIRPNIECPDLEQLITEVVDSVTAKEREVQDREGRWHLLRIRPYKSVENRIEGAVLVLLDIDAMRGQEERLRAAQAYAASLLELIDQPIAVLDGKLTVKSANHAFLRTFARGQRDVSGKSLGEVGDGHLDLPALTGLVERSLAATDGESTELISEVPALGRRLRINAQRLLGADGRTPSVVVAVRELSAGDGA
jgi:two-component system CheB/CheR fusion protein